MNLSIIIINYKSTALVLDCLEHLYREPIAGSFEVMIVDNASGDNGRQTVTAAWPAVRWIQMNENGGFARGNNEGIRQSHGDTVLLLNADTLPDGATIAECYRQLVSSDYIGAGVQLLNADGSPQISGNYFMKGGLNYLLPLPFLGNVFKWLGQKTKVQAPHVPGSAAGPSTDPVEVDWINGAFLMVKKSAIRQAGLLDEDFFLYAEEAEWCARLRKVGKLCLFPALHVIHLQGETTNQEFGSTGKGYYNLFDRKGLQIMLSNFVRIRKQFGPAWFLFQLFVYIADIPVFLIALPFSGRYSFSQFRLFCKNVAFVLRVSPIILRNKPYFYKVL